ncbi:ABC transporter permease subunit [symbiont of Argiope bruennichi]|uniref:ABC transporter permease n=1 Tax=symbiont of Argiope bruennichi TaxID=2810479 RepID=UPI003DA6517E
MTAKIKKEKFILLNKFPIFAYTFKKVFYSWSTLAFVVISFLVTSGLILFTNKVYSITVEKQLEIFSNVFEVTFFVINVCIFYLIFLAIKATQIFRDEIDDGTFLVIISKPITKNSLLLEKYFAFQTIGGIYILSILFYSAGFSLIYFNSLEIIIYFLRNLFFIIFFLIIFQIIFSSIFILISLFISTKSLIIFASIVVIFIVFFNVVVPFFIIPDLSNAYNEDVRKISFSLKRTILEEQNNYYFLSFFNLGYQFGNMFVFALNGFSHKSGTKLEMGDPGLFSRFGIIQYALIRTKGSDIEITGWTDFINAIYLYVFYIFFSSLMIYTTYFVLKIKDFQ